MNLFGDDMVNPLSEEARILYVPKGWRHLHDDEVVCSRTDRYYTIKYSGTGPIGYIYDDLVEWMVDGTAKKKNNCIVIRKLESEESMSDDFTADAKNRVPADCQNDEIDRTIELYQRFPLGAELPPRWDPSKAVTTDRPSKGPDCAQEMADLHRYQNVVDQQNLNRAAWNQAIEQRAGSNMTIEKFEDDVECTGDSGLSDRLKRAGVKYDSGKMRPTLVLDSFRNALKQVIEVGTFGANKYSDDGWKTVPNAKARYRDALYRHLMEDGNDPESSLPHLAHAAWNILALMELEAMDGREN